jgi:hypothetical protein
MENKYEEEEKDKVAKEPRIQFMSLEQIIDFLSNF